MNKKYEKMLADYDRHCQRIAKSATIDINELPAAKIRRIQEKEKDYIDWFEYYFGGTYAKSKCAWYHAAVAKLIIDHPQIYILFEVFRSGAKTVHINMGLPLFLYFTGRLNYHVLVGLTEPKAKRLLSGIQAQLVSNPRLKNDYGTRFKFGDWADGDFATTDGKRFRCFGFFNQSPRGELETDGQRPDYISVDDCDTKKHLGNEKLMTDYVEFIFEDLINCFDSSDGAIRRFVFANNNFHKKSLTNRIKTIFKERIIKARQRGQEPKFHILSVPAVKDLVNFEPNWPEKTSSQFWREQYEDLGHRAFCREFQHTHIDTGKIFKAENMQWKKMLPLDKYDALCFYGDLSYKDKGDFKGMFLVGKTGREIHAITGYLRQGSRSELAKWLYDKYVDWKLADFNIKYKIEGLFAMDEFLSDFDSEGDLRGFHIPITADKRGKANKFDRIESIEPFFHRHWFYFNEDEKESADQIELLDQFYDFEKGAEGHDDGPDCIHGGIDEVNRMAFVEKFDPVIIGRHDDDDDNYNLY